MDDGNCAEFCDHSHHYTVNGTEFVQNLDDPGLSSGCADKVSDGVVPNQAGLIGDDAVRDFVGASARKTRIVKVLDELGTVDGVVMRVVAELGTVPIIHAMAGGDGHQFYA